MFKDDELHETRYCEGCLELQQKFQKKTRVQRIRKATRRIQRRRACNRKYYWQFEATSKCVG